MNKFETAHNLSGVRQTGHVPVTAEFEFEYKKLKKERERLTTSCFDIGQQFQSDMEEHDLLEDNERIGL